MVGQKIFSRLGKRLKEFATGADGRSRLLEILSRQYIEEVHAVREFTAQLDRLEYPQFRERLRKIIASEEEHVRWLRGKISELGGEIPEVPSVSISCRNAWESFSKGLEDERRGIADLEEAELAARHIDPETADTLRRIREDEERHRETIVDMLTRSDPQAHLSR